MHKVIQFINNTVIHVYIVRIYIHNIEWKSFIIIIMMPQINKKKIAVLIKTLEQCYYFCNKSFRSTWAALWCFRQNFIPTCFPLLFFYLDWQNQLVVLSIFRLFLGKNNTLSLSQREKHTEGIESEIRLCKTFSHN